MTLLLERPERPGKGRFAMERPLFSVDGARYRKVHDDFPFCGSTGSEEGKGDEGLLIGRADFVSRIVRARKSREREEHLSVDRKFRIQCEADEISGLEYNAERTRDRRLNKYRSIIPMPKGNIIFIFGAHLASPSGRTAVRRGDNADA